MNDPDFPIGEYGIVLRNWTGRDLLQGQQMDSKKRDSFAYYNTIILIATYPRCDLFQAARWIKLSWCEKYNKKY